MNAKLHRWVDLLAALLRRRFPVGFQTLVDEVPAYGNGKQSPAARRRMFERDKKELRAFGIPVETRDLGEGELGYVLSPASFYLPYLHLLRDGRKTSPKSRDRFGYRSLPSLTFEPDELMAVARAARRVETLGVPSLTDDARSALRKLGHDLPEALEAPDDGVHRLHRGPKADEAVFEALSGALVARKRVTFSYRSMDRDETTDRVVEPYGLFYLGHHWYLAGSAPGETLVKNYRLSRIDSVQVNAEQPETPDYEIPKRFALAEHARSRQSWELGTGDVVEVTVRVARQTGAALAASRLGSEVDGDPSLRRFAVRRVDPVVRWLMGSAGDVVPVEPEAVVDRYRMMVKETAQRYAEAAS